MRAAGRTIAFIVIAAFASAPTSADDGGNAARSIEAALYLPLDEVLAGLESSAGFSFVYDSRLADGKRIPALDPMAPPRDALAQSLKRASLSLHQVAERTFAIRQAPVAAAAPAIQVAAPVATLADVVIVTGVAGSALAGADPSTILKLDSDALAIADAVNVADALRQLPQSYSTFTPANPVLVGALGGVNFADLRGLGPQRTQVLVDGRRRVGFPGGDFLAVDLNSIAEPLLARIEVLNAPGGAHTGPEAIAGVVNFVTRRDVDGIEVGIRHGLSQRKDFAEWSAHIIGGREFAEERIAAYGGVAFTAQGGLSGGARDLTRAAWGYDDTGALVQGLGGSPFTQNGLVSAGMFADGAIARPPGATSLWLNGMGGFEPFRRSQHQLYQWSEHQDFVVPVDRLVAIAGVEAALGDGVEAFVDAHYSRTRSTGTLAPVPATFRGTDPNTGDLVVVPFDHATVPAALAALYASGPYGAPDSLLLERRFTELGRREARNIRTFSGVLAGLRGSLGPDADWEASYRYGSASGTYTQFNLLDRERLAVALDPLACAQSQGCVAVNLFHRGGVTPDAANFIRAAPLARSLSISEQEVAARLQFSPDGFYGEPVQFALGVENRWSRFWDGGSDAAAHDVTGAFIIEMDSARMRRSEIHASVDAPLLRSKTFGTLDAGAAVRFIGDSDKRPAVMSEASARWRPAPGLRLSAEATLGRRPADIVETFADGSSIHQVFADPCASPAALADPTTAANCTSGGALAVSPGFSQPSLFTRFSRRPNPDLEPERVRAFAAGAEFSPAELFGAAPHSLRLTATWFSFALDDMPAAAPDTLVECYRSVALSSPACGVNPATGRPYFMRDAATGAVAYVDSFWSNSGAYRWRGLDFGASGAIDDLDMGLIDALWFNAIHTLALDVGQPDKDPLEESGVGSAHEPRHRTRVVVGIDAGETTAALTLHRRGRVDAPYTDPGTDRIAPSLIVDFALRWKPADSLAFTVGVKNIADALAPPVAGEVAMSQYYDVVGRRFSFSIDAAF